MRRVLQLALPPSRRIASHRIALYCIVLYCIASMDSSQPNWNPLFESAPMEMQYMERLRPMARAGWDYHGNSPHTKQAKHHFEGGKAHAAPEGTFSRAVRPLDPRAQYRRRTTEIKTVVHWGQRKLLMSEIEFLTMYACPGAIVVYAGAAPGSHIPVLLDMFPEIRRFDLVDPNGFAVYPSSRIRIRQQFFTDDTAREYAAEKHVLFISDIRTADISKLSELEVEEHVWLDMCDQKRWHEIIKPRKSMLKFRLPWRRDSWSEYLAGFVYLPVHGPKTTTEGRFVPTDGIMFWQNTAYEEQLFHFNTLKRVMLYPHNITCKDGLDHCYDCMSEVFIWRRYLLCYRHLWLHRSYGVYTSDQVKVVTPKKLWDQVHTVDDTKLEHVGEAAAVPPPGTHVFVHKTTQQLVADAIATGGDGKESRDETSRATDASVQEHKGCGPEIEITHSGISDNVRTSLMTHRQLWQIYVERLMCEAMPDAGRLGIAERHLEAEISRRVDSTSLFLSRKRSLAKPELDPSSKNKRGNKLVEVIREDIVKKREVLGITEEEIVETRKKQLNVHEYLRSQKIEKEEEKRRRKSWNSSMSSESDKASVDGGVCVRTCDLVHAHEGAAQGVSLQRRKRVGDRDECFLGEKPDDDSDVDPGAKRFRAHRR